MRLTQRPWSVAAALALVTALAALLRFHLLPLLPGEAGKGVAGMPGQAVPVAFLLAQREPLFALFEWMARRALGNDPLAVRIFAAAIGTLTVPALYALGREMILADSRVPRSAPLLAATVLAILRWHIMFSRVDSLDVLVPLLAILAIWAIWWALRSGSTVGWLLSALAGGLGLYAGRSGAAVPFALGAVLLAMLLADPTRLRRRSWRGPAAAGAVLVLFAFPLLLGLALRPDAPSIGASGTIFGNLWRTLAMFSFRGDPDAARNVPGMPALDVLLSIAFYLGVLISFRWRRAVAGGLLLAGLALLAPGVMWGTAPDFSAAIGAVPIVALLCGAGLAALLGSDAEDTLTGAMWVSPRLRDMGMPAESLASDMKRLRRAGRAIVVAAILVGSAVYSTTVYFGIWLRAQQGR